MSETHDHSHDHAHPTHTHDGKPIQEDPLPSLEAQILEASVRELLIEKGVISSDDVRRAIDQVESRTPALGAKIVARAWDDAEFKDKLMSDSDEALMAFGVDMRPTELCVVENTDDVHNMVVCTLCSCYPWPVLGLPPVWYKAAPYRARAVSEPRAVLKEFGVEIREGVEVRVWDSTAELRYMVLPERPAGTEGLGEDELAALVTRDSMIGVALVEST